MTVTLLALFLWRSGHWLVVETPLQPADHILFVDISSTRGEAIAIVLLLGSTPVETHTCAYTLRHGERSASDCEASRTTLSMALKRSHL